MRNLDIYGPSICHCGNRKETVFVGRYQLSCRNHPGHPLYESGADTPRGRASRRRLTSSTSAPARRGS